jgi:hypothetical protein
MRIAIVSSLFAASVLVGCGGGSGGGGGGGGGGGSFSGWNPTHQTVVNPGGAPDFRFGAAVAWLDWNDDGRPDVLVGSPGQQQGGTNGVGAAFVYTQNANGTFSLTLTLAPTQWAGGANVLDMHFGEAVAAGDFDGDGRDDVAVGAPGDTAPNPVPTAVAGRVYVVFNDAAHTATLKVGPFQEALPEAGAEFGATLAVGMLNADVRADLLIGVPEGTVSLQAGAGRVYGMLGNATIGSFGGLTAAVVSPTPTANANFGESMASGEVNGDGFLDLAVGEPGASDGSGGAVRVFAGDGSASNPTFAHLATCSASLAGANVELGTSTALVDLDGDGDDEVVAGAPFGDVGLELEAGYFIRFANAAGVFTPSAAIADRTPEAGAHFGFALVVGDFNGDLDPDVLASAPDSTVATIAGAGSVTVLFQTAGMLFAAPPAANVLASTSVLLDESFGTSIASFDSDADGTHDIVVVGAPGLPTPTLAGSFEVVTTLP